jgi:protoheme IX farnesyltransferase
MPPLIGYAAAGHGIDAGALALFLILFVWQFPHFDAISWMYRDDYARGGIRMLSVIDPDGESTARRIVVCSLLLIPISLVPLFLGMTGGLYAAAAVVAGLVMLYFGVRMARQSTLARARALLLATVFYLPAILGVMVLDGRLL